MVKRHVSMHTIFDSTVTDLASFRDVFLVGFPQDSRIENVFAQTLFDSSYIDATLKVKITTTGPGNVRVKLLNAQKETLASRSVEIGNDPTVEVSIPVEGPLKWTAESPNLYHLVLSLNSEQYVSHRIGFRQVEMKDGLIKVNGKRIVFRGVNRHEHHPELGRVVPLDFLKEDLLIMKRHNINAIRTSHQLNDPRLYDLADEMGFWVMDEADLECHGFETIADAALSSAERKLPFRERQLLTRKKAAEWTTNNPDWKHAYIDRAQHLVKRDQLHPSIIIWSLGNEAFFGQNFKAMYEWIKSYDDSRPIHYEADIYAETMDMFSRMYPPIDEIIKFGEDSSKTKPLVLCEYVSEDDMITGRLLMLYRFTPWATDPETSKSILMRSISTLHCRAVLLGSGLIMGSLQKTRRQGTNFMPTVGTSMRKYMIPHS